MNVCPDLISSTRTSILEELVPVLAMSVRDLMCAQHHDGMHYEYRTSRSEHYCRIFYHTILKVRSIEERIQYYRVSGHESRVINACCCFLIHIFSARKLAHNCK